jgi:phosphoribosylformimino-5-aminoimidazole carboxamide ribotide isomerase
MRIIPAIDVLNGKCVRLTQGDYASVKIYRDDPLDAARQLEDLGFKYLHIVDLDGARSNRIVNYRVLRKIATKTCLTIDFGGGVKSDEDLQIAFENGAKQVTGGSIAVKDPDRFKHWIDVYGADRIILGADSRDRQIRTEGWETGTELDVLDYLMNWVKKGIRYTICTDIRRDGMLQGPALDLYSEILSQRTIHLIASGGISTLEDVVRLKELGCEGAIIGKAIYEQTIDLKKLAALC